MASKNIDSNSITYTETSNSHLVQENIKRKRTLQALVEKLERNKERYGLPDRNKRVNDRTTNTIDTENRIYMNKETQTDAISTWFDQYVTAYMRNYASTIAQTEIEQRVDIQKILNMTKENEKLKNIHSNLEKQLSSISIVSYHENEKKDRRFTSGGYLEPSPLVLTSSGNTYGRVDAPITSLTPPVDTFIENEAGKDADGKDSVTSVEYVTTDYEDTKHESEVGKSDTCYSTRWTPGRDEGNTEGQVVPDLEKCKNHKSLNISDLVEDGNNEDATKDIDSSSVISSTRDVLLNHSDEKNPITNEIMKNKEEGGLQISSSFLQDGVPLLWYDPSMVKPRSSNPEERVISSESSFPVPLSTCSVNGNGFSTHTNMMRASYQHHHQIYPPPIHPPYLPYQHYPPTLPFQQQHPPYLPFQHHPQTLPLHPPSLTLHPPSLSLPAQQRHPHEVAMEFIRTYEYISTYRTLTQSEKDILTHYREQLFNQFHRQQLKDMFWRTSIHDTRNFSKPVARSTTDSRLTPPPSPVSHASSSSSLKHKSKTQEILSATRPEHFRFKPY